MNNPNIIVSTNYLKQLTTSYGYYCYLHGYVECVTYYRSIISQHIKAYYHSILPSLHLRSLIKFFIHYTNCLTFTGQIDLANKVMICDLNIVYPVSDYNQKITKDALIELKKTLDIVEQLGYTHVALNFTPETLTSKSNKVKLPNDLNLINPINLTHFKEYDERLRIYTRITVKVDDPSQCQSIAKFQQIFDLVAVEPQTEKAFQSAITNLDVDIITFNLQQRLPCYMKHKTLGSAIEKGIFFEIKYSDFLVSKNRAQAISNCKQIVRASRNRGMIVSSGCQVNTPYQLRNSANVVPVLKMLGIDSNRANQMFKDWSLKVLLNGRLRIKSYKQTIAVADDEGLIGNVNENKDWNSNVNVNNKKLDINSYKKRKTETSLDRIVKKQK